MKQKDFALIIVAVFVSAVLSLVMSKLVLNKPQDHKQKAEVVTPISATFTPPDEHYFNSDSIDPTKQITISKNDNANPFNSATPQ